MCVRSTDFVLASMEGWGHETRLTQVENILSKPLVVPQGGSRADTLKDLVAKIERAFKHRRREIGSRFCDDGSLPPLLTVVQIRERAKSGELRQEGTPVAEREEESSSA